MCDAKLLSTTLRVSLIGTKGPKNSPEQKRAKYLCEKGCLYTCDRIVYISFGAIPKKLSLVLSSVSLLYGYINILYWHVIRNTTAKTVSENLLFQKPTYTSLYCTAIFQTILR